MPISIVCTSCKAKLKVKDDQEGKTIKCPKCATALEVTVPELEPEEIAEEPEDAKKAEKKDSSKKKQKVKSDESKSAEAKETSDDADESEKAEGESADDKPRKKKIWAGMKRASSCAANRWPIGRIALGLLRSDEIPRSLSRKRGKGCLESNGKE